MQIPVSLGLLGLLAVTAYAAPSQRWTRNYVTFHVYTETQCPISANKGEITAREGDDAAGDCWSLSALYHDLPAVEAIYFSRMTAKDCRVTLYSTDDCSGYGTAATTGCVNSPEGKDWLSYSINTEDCKWD